MRGPTALLLALLPLVACATPAPRRSVPVHSATSAPAPSWGAEPLTWEKLRDIEDWLEGPEAFRHPEAVPAAELELAEGRLALARRDRGSIAESVIALRLDLARDGFRRALEHPRASTLERSRAQAGLGRVRGMRGPSSTVPATATGALSIAPRSAWGARTPVSTRLRANQRPWTRITVHHSAIASAPLRGGGQGATLTAIRNIQKIHMENEGWGDIGYHFLIDPTGRIYQGRSLAWQGAHAGGVNNVANIGICLLGNFDEERPDPRALRTLDGLISALARRHGIPRSAVKGHRDYKATACPGNHLASWVKSYAAGRG